MLRIIYIYNKKSVTSNIIFFTGTSIFLRLALFFLLIRLSFSFNKLSNIASDYYLEIICNGSDNDY